MTLELITLAVGNELLQRTLNTADEQISKLRKELEEFANKDNWLETEEEDGEWTIKWIGKTYDPWTSAQEALK